MLGGEIIDEVACEGCRGGLPEGAVSKKAVACLEVEPDFILSLRQICA